MPTTIQNIYTPLPTKTDDMSWDTFSSLILSAYEAERQRLTEEIARPTTPPRDSSQGYGYTAPEWMKYHELQRAADKRRTEALAKYEPKLIASIAEALDASVPFFKELLVRYEGSGDSGENCDISVELEWGFKPTKETSWGSLCYTHQENEQMRAREKAAYDLMPSALINWLDETCWSLAYNEFPGFEIDAGGFGTITVKRDDAGVMKVYLDHTARYESTEEYQTEELG